MEPVLKRNIYVSYLVQVFNIGLNFAISLLIVRQLGAAAYGEYSVFFNSIAFAVLLLGFNLPAVIIFFIANGRIDPAKLLFSSLLFVLLTGILLLGILFYSDRLGMAVHIFPGAENRPLWIFFFSVVFLLLQMNQVLQAFLNVHRIFIPLAFFNLSCNALTLVFWLLVGFKVIVFTGALFNVVWWVSIGTNLAICIYSLYLAAGTGLLRLPGLLLRGSELRQIGHFAAIVYLCNTLQFLNYKMDIWFVNYYGGKEQAGIYSLALGLSQLIWILPNTASTILYNYFREDDRGDSIQLAIQYGRLGFYASIISAILLSVVYYFAIPFFYGEAFSDTFFLCVVLFTGVVPFALSIILANLNSGIGFVKLNLYATIFTFVLGALLDILLIPAYGLRGAAAAKAVIYISGLIFQLIVANKRYDLPWRSFFGLPGREVLKMPWQRPSHHATEKNT